MREAHRTTIGQGGSLKAYSTHQAHLNFLLCPLLAQRRTFVIARQTLPERGVAGTCSSVLSQGSRWSMAWCQLSNRKGATLYGGIGFAAVATRAAGRSAIAVDNCGELFRTVSHSMIESANCVDFSVYSAGRRQPAAVIVGFSQGQELARS